MHSLNLTHDPQIKSWLATANRPDGNFPLQNLPFAVFRRAQSHEAFRGGVAIGDQVIDLAAVAALVARDSMSSFSADAIVALEAGRLQTLNQLMQLGPRFWSALRLALFEGFRTGSSLQSQLERCLIPQAGVEFTVPAQIGNYTDFYASIYHATAVGRLFRPDEPLLPNYHWLPIGYHGRASSIGISGQSFHRPTGQIKISGESAPVLKPSARLDYELELGVFVGTGNPLGARISIREAESQVFGLCLLNDWSARDIQAWEYQPLGPFLAKNFATTISPWIVTLEALAPFRSPCTRPDGPPLLDYLDSLSNRQSGSIDIHLETLIRSSSMREANVPAYRLASTSFRHSYWTIAQLVAHHTINGCNLQPGDLLGTGTQSGPTPAEAGSLLELSQGGKQSFAISPTEQRTFLEDGDVVIMRGWCESPSATRIGFGEVIGQVLPAVKL